MTIVVLLGVESDLGKIKTVSITPNPPKKGQVLNLEATVELSKTHLFTCWLLYD